MMEGGITFLKKILMLFGIIPLLILSYMILGWHSNTGTLVIFEGFFLCIHIIKMLSSFVSCNISKVDEMHA